jgi:hypothetical protein
MMWNRIGYVLTRLGSGGISDDETEIDELPSDNTAARHLHLKTVRRIRLPWLNTSISYLLEAVDSYKMEPIVSRARDSRGNVSYQREYTARRTDDRKSVVGLPCNWYDAEWYSRRTRAEKARLQAGKRIAIPDLVRFRIYDFETIFKKI